MTCMATCGGGTTALFALAWKPESMPPWSGAQGVSNADCVTVWFWPRKVKMTVSPMAALISGGLNARPVGPPTVTLCGGFLLPTTGAAAGGGGGGAPAAGGGGGGGGAPPPPPVAPGGGGVAVKVCVTVTVEAGLLTPLRPLRPLRMVVKAPPPRLIQSRLTSMPLPLLRPSKRSSCAI